MIVVSPAFEGVRFLDRVDVVMNILPPGYEVIAWSPKEAEAQLRRPTLKAALCRGYTILVDALHLGDRVIGIVGCSPADLASLKAKLKDLI